MNKSDDQFSLAPTAHTPNCHRVQRSAEPGCLPANYNTTSPTLLLPPPPVCLPVPPILSTSFFCYMLQSEDFHFITFNYRLCQRSPSHGWLSYTSSHSINPPTEVYPFPTCSQLSPKSLFFPSCFLTCFIFFFHTQAWQVPAALPVLMIFFTYC